MLRLHDALLLKLALPVKKAHAGPQPSAVVRTAAGGRASGSPRHLCAGRGRRRTSTVSDLPRIPKKSGWQEELEEIIRAEIADDDSRTRALKALEYTMEDKNALILGLLATLEHRIGTGESSPDADLPR